ncbi:MAG: PrsW family intrarane metalloprotease [Frankiales bacterium]|nr:PrsW family intrarane metalloprotease [Frankiales bacterium]
MPVSGQREFETEACFVGTSPRQRQSDHMTLAPPPPGRARPSELLPLGDWLRHRSVRSWRVLLFLALICTPVIALVVLGDNPSEATFDHVAWIFAAYFAVAWLLLLGVIIRPEHVTRPMLILITVISLATEVPLAITLESALHATTGNLAESIFTVGVPEELAKAVPVLALALIYWRRRTVQPREYLFLGAVSGLAFGASEVVHYFTVNGVDEFYQTVQSAIPSIDQLVSAGQSPSVSVFAVLIGPVRYFILDFVWRFLTDPIMHACWAGLTGYFIGLAVTKRHKWYAVAWVGLAVAAVLHGLNDWGEVNGRPLWIVVSVVSGVLFLGYAKVGASADRTIDAETPPAFRLHHRSKGHPLGSFDAEPAEPPAKSPAEASTSSPWKP